MVKKIKLKEANVTENNVEKGKLQGSVRAEKNIDPFDPTTWSEEEAAYFNKVSKLFLSDRPSIVSNSRPRHAVFIMQKLLENAKKSVKILSGDLCLYSDQDNLELWANEAVINSLEDYLRKDGVSLEIVCVNDIDSGLDSHPVYKAIQKMVSNKELDGKASISVMTEHQESIKHHYMIVDNKSYRLETDLVNKEAIVAINNEKDASVLTSAFEYLQSARSNLVYSA